MRYGRSCRTSSRKTKQNKTKNKTKKKTIRYHPDKNNPALPLPVTNSRGVWLETKIQCGKDGFHETPCWVLPGWTGLRATYLYDPGRDTSDYFVSPSFPPFTTCGTSESTVAEDSLPQLMEQQVVTVFLLTWITFFLTKQETGGCPLRVGREGQV
ncbi:hypothetical protein L873DRAFT_171271 [Choiromyces venosus 120613-1]|uniref:Uncharacterized protein n=1 Tax=Choiromyces venosus 120613-1 TaxID=1336337 RepID=A0A3N4JYR5_9PEZI|nr:hypothetical protein L873DRAFT_171271 [Choiromyces venosus 120613-1]